MDDLATWGINVTSNVSEETNQRTSEQENHASLEKFYNSSSLFITLLFLRVLAAIFHIGGLYLLLKVRGKQITSSNNDMVSFTNSWLLILLSFTELLASLLTIIVIFSKYMILSTTFLIVGVFANLSGGMSLSIVYLMTLNRLLSTLYPLWYRTSLTRTKFVVFTVLLSMLVTSLNLLFHLTNEGFIESPIMSWIGVIILHIIYDSYFVLCVFTYAVILMKISKSQRNFEANDEEHSTSRSICPTLRRKGFITPFLITFTYMLFVVVPFVGILICHFYGCFAAMVVVWYITNSFNTISDALIYVFFDRKIRHHLKKLICGKNTLDVALCYNLRAINRHGEAKKVNEQLDDNCRAFSIVPEL